MAPFEKNLEVWRQLWRVVERSDLLVQIVDSRNPLLFHCPDVDVYVKEVHPCKQTVLIVNKADLIPEYARVQWGRYFDSINLPFVFFSAKASSQVIDQELERKEKEEQAKRGEEANNDNSEEKEEEEKEDKEEEEEEEEKEDKKPVWRSRNAFAGLDFDDSSEEEETEEEEKEEEEKEEESAEPSSQPSAEPSIASDIRNYLTEDILEPSIEPTTQPSIEPTTQPSTEPSTEPSAPDLFSQEDASELASLHCTAEEQRRYRIHSRGEVLAFLEAKTQAAFEAVQAYDRAHPSSTASPDFADRRAVVGMLGFPNVGKSSLINVLLGVSATSHGAVRVAVGATPGKTKHLQTVVLSDSLLLCDCPGLVFPVFMNTKADLLFNGVLPASNMRDYISIGLLSRRLTARPRATGLPARGARGTGARVPHQAGPPSSRPAQRGAASAPAPRGGVQAARIHGLEPQRRERAARSHRDSEGRAERRAAMVDSAAQLGRHSAEPHRVLHGARGGDGPQ